MVSRNNPGTALSERGGVLGDGRFPGIICAWLMVAGLGWAAPKLDRILPLGLVPDRTNQLTFYGENLDQVDGVWASLSDAPFTNKLFSSVREITFLMPLPDTVPVGIALVRLFGSSGVSNPRLVMVDDISTQSDESGVPDIHKAAKLQFPGAVDGVMPDLSRHYFRFNAQSNQRVSFEVLAERLGSSMDPVLRLLDGRKHEILRIDDSPGVGVDVRFQHVLEEAGPYWLELHDVNYGGGSRFFYRLRAGDFPLATLPYPSAVPPGQEVPVIVLGDRVEGVEPIQAQLPASSSGSTLGVRYPEGKTSGFVWLEARACPRLPETEVNDELASATKSDPFPVDFYGRFEKAGDRDYWEFKALKGSRLTFQVRTRSMGSPCDLWMQLLDGDGSELEKAKVNEGEDGLLVATIPADGKYYLLVEELNGDHGPDLAYRIECSEFHSGFELSMDTDHVNVEEGGDFKLKVSAARLDYDGPIQLMVQGLVGELKVEDALIPEKKQETTLKLTLPDTVRGGTIHVLKVIGTAMVGDREHRTEADCRPALNKLFPGLDRFPPGMDTALVLGVMEP